MHLSVRYWSGSRSGAVQEDEDEGMGFGLGDDGDGATLAGGAQVMQRSLAGSGTYE